MSREDETSEKICCSGSSLPFCLGMTEYNCCGVPEPTNITLNFCYACSQCFCRDSISQFAIVASFK